MDDLFSVDPKMSTTEIVMAAVDYVSDEVSEADLNRLYLPENVSRALAIVLEMFAATAHALQQESPDLPVKTNLRQAAGKLASLMES